MPKVPQPAKPLRASVLRSGMAKITKTSSRSSATRGHFNRENLRERKVTTVIIRHSGHGHVTKQPRGDNDDADGAIVGKIHNMRISKFFLQHVVLQYRMRAKLDRCCSIGNGENQDVYTQKCCVEHHTALHSKGYSHVAQHYYHGQIKNDLPTASQIHTMLLTPKLPTESFAIIKPGVNCQDSENENSNYADDSDQYVEYMQKCDNTELGLGPAATSPRSFSGASFAAGFGEVQHWDDCPSCQTTPSVAPYPATVLGQRKIRAA